MSDWSLFGVAWATLVVAAISLALPGVIVVARGQSILAIAASQCAACGAAAAMFFIGITGGGHIHGDPRIHLGAMIGGLLGTGLAWQGNSERAGWLFGLASAGTVLLVANSPYGMHDILALQHSNVLTADVLELMVFSIFAAISIIILSLHHRTVRLLAIDPAHLTSCGVAHRFWQVGMGLWLGVGMSLAVSTFGLLITFCWLILPTMIAAQFVRTLWPLFILAPAIAAFASLGGIIMGHTWDLPPGQTTAALLAGLYPCALIISRLPLAK